jgi:hypothetical protein
MAQRAHDVTARGTRCLEGGAGKTGIQESVHGFEGRQRVTRREVLQKTAPSMPAGWTRKPENGLTSGGSGPQRPCAKESSGNCNQHGCSLHANRDVRKSVITLAPTGFYGADRGAKPLRSVPLRSINVHIRPGGVHRFGRVQRKVRTLIAHVLQSSIGQ